MSSTKKNHKTSKRLHWGRDGKWLKGVLKLRGVAFYTSSQRLAGHMLTRSEAIEASRGKE